MTEEERKQRQREYARRYRSNHPELAEHIREKAREYYWKHKEEKLAYDKRYRKEHSLAVSDRRHSYYIEHKEEISAWQKEYRRKKKENEKH